MGFIKTLAFIPSPSSSVLSLGPLKFHAYGVAIALAVLAAVWLSNKRWLARGGTTEDVMAVATWGVPAGIIGARIYHVITDFEIYRHDLGRMFLIWDGGLGIWGGIAGGVLVGALAGKRRGLSVLALADVAAPGLILAQAVGRWGNYFNQELFGGPTTLPWGLKISPEHRPTGYEQYSTFHPTFLYESIWNLFVCAVLLYVDRRFKPKPGGIFLLYVSMYTFGRFFIERLRIDFAHTFLGLRLNDWTSIIVFTVSTGLLVYVLRADTKRKALTT